MINLIFYVKNVIITRKNKAHFYTGLKTVNSNQFFKVCAKCETLRKKKQFYKVRI